MAIGFVKGHGTENDFVLIPDADGALADRIDTSAVRRLTDRHVGLGADGVIRIVPTAKVDGHADAAADAQWFMDYRNADGSIAEMCGNGVRVMARYLWEAGWVSGATITIATRRGIRLVHAETDGTFTVEMGPARTIAGPHTSIVSANGHTWPATPVWVPNPHAVVFVDALDAPGLLVDRPGLGPASVFPESANIEFVVGRGPAHIALRVWERGVGETRSCGTAVCAAVWATMRRDGVSAGRRYTVDVAGGQLAVTERPDGQMVLTGPATLGVRGEITLAL
jgi:diaminopimelate epimerase